MVQILSPAASPFGLPTVTQAGENNQVSVKAVNNSGMPLPQGAVLVWDTNTTATTTPATQTVSGAQTLTNASFTLTCAGSTASFPASGAIIVDATPAAPYPLNQPIPNFTNLPPQVAGANTRTLGIVPMFVTYTGIAGSTFTGCQAAYASATNGAASGASVVQWPSQQVGTAAANVGLPAAPSDAGRYVTLSTTAAAQDPRVAGVLSVDGTASTNGALIMPGAGCYVCRQGIARVNIGAATVAAFAQLATAAAAPGQAATPGAAASVAALQALLGTFIGVSIESQAAKDANNTIRADITLC